MSGKERIDYLLTKVPEDKKEAFVEDLKGVAGLEEGLSVLKKYGISLTEEEMQKLTAKRELSNDELDATTAGGDGASFGGGCDCPCPENEGVKRW